MSISFALITDKELDYYDLVKKTTSYFNLEFDCISPLETSVISENFILNISPRRLFFIIPTIDETFTQKSLHKIRNFITYTFKNKKLALTSYTPFIINPLGEVSDVKLVSF